MRHQVDVSPIVSLIKDFDYEMLDDCEWDALKKVDPNDEARMLEVFRKTTVPEYEAMDGGSRSLIKASLADALSLSDFDFDYILGSVEMPFEPIDQPRKFFETLWLALFRTRFD